jgi:hypothetical protein
MLETYKAKLQGNRLVWNGQAPAVSESGVEVDVVVTFVEPIQNGSTLRPVGLAAGEFLVPDDFDAPLPEAFLSEFEN